MCERKTVDLLHLSTIDKDSRVCPYLDFRMFSEPLKGTVRRFRPLVALWSSVFVSGSLFRLYLVHTNKDMNACAHVSNRYFQSDLLTGHQLASQLLTCDEKKCQRKACKKKQPAIKYGYKCFKDSSNLHD